MFAAARLSERHDIGALPLDAFEAPARCDLGSLCVDKQEVVHGDGNRRGHAFKVDVDVSRPRLPIELDPLPTPNMAVRRALHNFLPGVESDTLDDAVINSPTLQPGNLPKLTLTPSFSVEGVEQRGAFRQRGPRLIDGEQVNSELSGERAAKHVTASALNDVELYSRPNPYTFVRHAASLSARVLADSTAAKSVRNIPEAGIAVPRQGVAA